MWVARRPPGYAFVEFDDRRDALDAIRALDGMFIVDAELPLLFVNGSLSRFCLLLHQMLLCIVNYCSIISFCLSNGSLALCVLCWCCFL